MTWLAVTGFVLVNLVFYCRHHDLVSGTNPVTANQVMVATVKY
jgi:hypothetical protein